VIYLQEVLDGWLGAGKSRVILPITDPYVVHHGALGSFATIYLEAGIDAGEIGGLLSRLRGMELVLPNEAACARFELPPDRVGDLVAISRRDVVLGTSPARHDLSGLDAPLRSHGGISEQRVPLLLNRPTPDLSVDAKLRNFSAFDLALNHAVAAAPALSRAV
jgi:phosphonoacetate hydrolase